MTRTRVVQANKQKVVTLRMKPKSSKNPKRKNKKNSPNMKSSISITNAPLARSYRMRQQSPRVASTNGSLRVAHREYVRPIQGTAEYTTTQDTVNPGLDSLFPWLSAIASRYEFYTFRSLKFEYVPRCSATTAGTVGAYLDADVLDPVSPTRAAFFSNANAVADVPWNAWTMSVPASVLQRRSNLYTRTAAITAGDARLYDFGNLFVMTDQNASAFGDLYVSYVVDFHTPQTKDTVQSISMQRTSIETLTTINSGTLETVPMEVGQVINDKLASGTISPTVLKQQMIGLLEANFRKVALGALAQPPCEDKVRGTYSTDAIEVTFPHAWRGRISFVANWLLTYSSIFPTTPETSGMLQTIDADDGRNTVVTWKRYFNNSRCAGLAGSACPPGAGASIVDTAFVVFDIDVGKGGGFTLYAFSSHSNLTGLVWLGTDYLTFTPMPATDALPDESDSPILDNVQLSSQYARSPLLAALAAVPTSGRSSEPQSAARRF